MLIVHQGAIGDLILSLPALHAIRAAYPHHQVEMLGYPRILRLLHRRFYADTIASIERAMFAPLYQDEPPADPSLRAYCSAFDPIFVFGGRAQDLSAAHLRGMTGGRVFCVRPFPETGHMHVSDFQISQLRGWGIRASEREPVLFPAAEDVSEASRLLADNGLPAQEGAVMAVHPGSGSSRKNWAPHCFAVLIKRTAAMHRGRVVLIAGPADDEPCRRVTQELACMRVTVVRRPELTVLAGLLRHCSLYVGNDSGVTHIVAALGVPTLALFGPTDPAVWGPRGRRVCILRGSDKRHGWSWPSVDAVVRESSALFQNSAV